MRKIAFKLKNDAGQSLVELALVTPFLLLIALNAINFGYYFFVAVNVAAAPRHAVEYAILGPATPYGGGFPLAGPASSATSVSALAYADIQNSLPSYTTATVQVCSLTVPGGLNNAGTATQTAKCCATTSSSSVCTVGGGSFPSPAADPESPAFVLHRVDIQYTVTPLIPGTTFGIQLLPSFTFHQQVSMREL